MLLQNKTAVVYGGGGAIGRAVARTFAGEGANVFLAGRTLARLHTVGCEIVDAGGVAESTEVNAFDEEAVEKHVDTVVRKAGAIDILFNAIGIPK